MFLLLFVSHYCFYVSEPSFTVDFSFVELEFLDSGVVTVACVKPWQCPINMINSITWYFVVIGKMEKIVTSDIYLVRLDGLANGVFFFVRECESFDDFGVGQSVESVKTFCFTFIKDIDLELYFYDGTVGEFDVIFGVSVS